MKKSYCLLCKVVKIGEKIVFGKTPEVKEGGSYVDVLEKSIPGKG